MMESEENQIHSLGIEVMHILLGCMYLCQPVGFGINKTLKYGKLEKWGDWMLEGNRIANGTAKEPTRHLIVEWLVDLYLHTPSQTVRNAWMKTGYECFEKCIDYSFVHLCG